MELLSGMSDASPQSIAYQRSSFRTHLPVGCRYSPTHYWLAPQPDGTHRIGLTKFAVRMLGDMVEHRFDIAAGAPILPGQIIGWLEGFKAITDIYCVASGTWLVGNPLLLEKISLINRDPHGQGWLYAVQGQPDERCLGVQEYAEHLDRTIDLILSKEPPAQ
jgi:glycine cleavage system H protein